ncbi:hypothetical protein [Saccharopolyspora pogona]|uniref:hypothetical protein n=1 Tax=Saccharopolyspora pogona TaxID=333966 RepID=UPI001CC231E1|nr:hypothetical protein [Saccharopolyspora pogona]
MIAWIITAGTAAVLLTIWPMYRSYFYRPQHAGSGEGALTVRYLVARINTETTNGGRHRLREPPAGCKDSAETLLVSETRPPTTDHDSFTRRSEILSRILAGLERL